MNTDNSLQTVARRVRSLLDCSSVTLSLSCPSIACHPLLTLYAASHEAPTYSSSEYNDFPALSTYRETQTLIANALHTCSAQANNNLTLPNAGFASVVAVPLARPAGILGMLLCVDTQPNRFLRGECGLLAQSMPVFAQEVEGILCDALTGFPQEEGEAPPATVHEQQTLVSLVGHDLRLPLTAIKGYAGLLQAYGPATVEASAQEALPLELQQHYLNVIMEQTQHMEVLINDLLDVSRIQRGQLALRNAWVNLTVLCRRVVQLMQDKVDLQEAGRYCIRCRFDAPVILAWADPDRVQQILTNLIENAVKYSPDGGLIEVQVRNSPALPLVTVRDWGMGIPAPQQAALFNVFKRGEQATQRNVVGLGLGLYIVRTLVEAMAGSLTLQSSEGYGTSVSFTLSRNPAWNGETPPIFLENAVVTTAF